MESLKLSNSTLEVNYLPVLSQIIESIAKLAPWDLAEPWDRVGLQIGDNNKTINKVLISLDYNQRLLEEGLKLGVDGFIVHHPLIFKPLNRLTNLSSVENQVASLLKHDLFLIAAHTNIDKAKQGLNQYLAEQLALEDIKPLEPIESCSYKVVVYTPEPYLAAIREAMAQAGAGVIGEYRRCSFETKGIGTFEPGASARPFCGNPGVFESIPEIRLEMFAEKNHLPDIIQAVNENHPYQEPVVDIFRLSNPSFHGIGRIGHLKQPVTFEEFCHTVKSKLSCKEIQIAGDLARPVKRVALCSGSGHDYLTKAISCHADLYLTGELNYHDFINAGDNYLAVIAAGHWGTEHCFVDLMADYLKVYFNSEQKFEVIKGESQAEPYLTL